MSIKNVVDRLRAAAGQLNAISDRVDAVVMDTEAWIRETSVGVSALVVDSHLGTHRLMIHKHRIGIGESFENMKPWKDCARDLRLRAFPALPRLVEQIALEAAQLLERAASVDAIVVEVRAAINGPGTRLGEPGGEPGSP